MSSSYISEIWFWQNTEDLDVQVQDEERAICASSDNDGTSKIHIIEHCKFLLKSDMMLNNYMAVWIAIGCYVY